MARNENTWTLTTSDGVSRDYDSIILAAPYHLSGISINPPINNIPNQPYIHLYVTLLTTGLASPRPEYFSLQPDSSAPSSILTTYAYCAETGVPPDFNSLTYLNRIKGQDGGPDEYLAKIFSMQPIDTSWLRKVFGRYSWVHKKEVNHLFTLVKKDLISLLNIIFSGFHTQLPLQTSHLLPLNRLLICSTSTPLNRSSNLPLLFQFLHLNFFVRFISTMETETVSEGITL